MAFDSTILQAKLFLKTSLVSRRRRPSLGVLLPSRITRVRESPCPIFLMTAHTPSIHRPYTIHTRIHTPSLYHPFTLHTSSIYHPYTIHTPLLHHPFTLHTASIHHPYTIHTPSIHHPCIVHTCGWSRLNTETPWQHEFREKSTFWSEARFAPL